MSTERVIVQRGASEKLISLIKQTISTIKAGNYADYPKVQLSALFSTASAENVIGMIGEAQAEGAEVLVGDVKNEGAVVQPHVITCVKPGMRLWERESFGPSKSANTPNPECPNLTSFPYLKSRNRGRRRHRR